MYQVDVYCRNCGWEGNVVINDGVLIRDRECPICGCYMLVKENGAVARRVPRIIPQEARENTE